MSAYMLLSLYTCMVALIVCIFLSKPAWEWEESSGKPTLQQSAEKKRRITKGNVTPWNYNVYEDHFRRFWNNTSLLSFMPALHPSARDTGCSGFRIYKKNWNYKRVIHILYTFFYMYSLLPSSLQELEELSLTDHQQQLEMQTAEFEHLCATIEQTRGRLEGLP